MQPRSIIVIGSGFAGLSAASSLAKQGHRVTVLEKNDQPGGRARAWQKDGFVFDMGPSWYWMPEVFENFYNIFGKTASDFYTLIRLNPSYRVFFSNQQSVDVPASRQELLELFEQKEPGSAQKLNEFLNDAEYKYRTAMTDYVHRVGNSLTEFFDIKLILKSLQLNLFRSLRHEVRKRFRHPQLISILEFPVLFLGSTPDKTPALYSMMNYADLELGTWYPMGGMHRIVKAFVQIATEQGVQIKCNEEVVRIEIRKGKARLVHTRQGSYEADLVVAGSDYQFTEQKLLDPDFRLYNQQYWDTRTMSPSCLLYYLGISKKLKGLLHHNLFFDADFEQHASEIYANPRWPTSPLFYVCAPSVTDNSVAPEGCENLFLLMPIAPGLTDDEHTREKYFRMMIQRIEARLGEKFSDHIIVKRSYCIRDFEQDYHAFKGNAYGLANTLMQTAVFKPKMISPKVSNLFYTGQLTVPGPGVPPSIISGQIVAREIDKRIRQNQL
ncbi:MAG: phytoene desaturase family protein [Chitinophagales bacterium]|nr:phytoene desaturase family protein [Chitinophagales bacterium]MDW8418487.1 phytoene desaturase family protein [Chitinophagales bacterium]